MSHRHPEIATRDACEHARLRADLIRVLRIPAGSADQEIVARAKDLADPTVARIRYAELCPDCSTCLEAAEGVWPGCTCSWEDMGDPLDIEDDGVTHGDEDEVRVCDCKVAWIAVRCRSCRSSYDAMVRDDETAHAEREEAAVR